MPKYWGKQIFAHGWVKSKRRRREKKERERERLNDGNNNGQATHGARKHAWRTQARMAHASRWGQKFASDQWLNSDYCAINY